MKLAHDDLHYDGYNEMINVHWKEVNVDYTNIFIRLGESNVNGFSLFITTIN